MNRESLIDILLLLTIISVVLLLLYFRKKIGDLLLEIMFSKREAKIVNVALEQSKGSQKYWLLNQVVVPLSIIYAPYIFTLINEHFGTIYFQKNLGELTLTGALTIMGINIMRINLTAINEKLSNNILDNMPWFQKILEDNESLKSKLRSLITCLTFFASIIYIALVCNFIVPDKPKSGYYIFVVWVLFVMSVICARILAVVQQNFAKDDEKLRTHFAIENKKEKLEYEELKDRAKKEGGLL